MQRKKKKEKNETKLPVKHYCVRTFTEATSNGKRPIKMAVELFPCGKDLTYWNIGVLSSSDSWRGNLMVDLETGKLYYEGCCIKEEDEFIEDIVKRNASGELAAYDYVEIPTNRLQPMWAFKEKMVELAFANIGKLGVFGKEFVKTVKNGKDYDGTDCVAVSSGKNIYTIERADHGRDD